MKGKEIESWVESTRQALDQPLLPPVCSPISFGTTGCPTQEVGNNTQNNLECPESNSDASKASVVNSYTEQPTHQSSLLTKQPVITASIIEGESSLGKTRECPCLIS